ncbi:MAG: hypothetical protein J0M14_18090 [Candidatus Accumulibacter sp.]|jgi:hypothetical protein|uniref:hypothetical protein n=1 Tax=Accumulibacter sp. TaxID=2053492 RepID=UPI001AD02B00|nr:hypothetical protein [Accumulibacter sp.]MBN8516147.1 hypothetical protein [Accumulibacter sp.]MBO3701378.1 hypothetical protein [Accumulibacter sp.]HRE72912.1 hypothetical protein [Accumulibacter sp.]HRI93552.1 hypothetical protein [Accumulibacter sp.]
MKELPPAAGNEWRHLYGATFTSLFLTRFCNGKRSAKISLRTSRSVWVDLRGGRKIEAGLRLEKRALSCGATPAWPNAFRTCTRCERRGSQGIGIIINRLLANAILLSLVRHK